jgi:hypothetical protein
MLFVVYVVELRVVAAAIVFLVMAFDQLAVVDYATPGTRLDLLHLDEGLEAGQIRPHGALYVAHPAGRFLDPGAWLDVE